MICIYCGADHAENFTCQPMRQILDDCRIGLLRSSSSEQPVHTDHPSRHWDRTCPACLAEGLSVEKPEVKSSNSESNNAPGHELPAAAAKELPFVSRGTQVSGRDATEGTSAQYRAPGAPSSPPAITMWDEEDEAEFARRNGIKRPSPKEKHSEGPTPRSDEFYDYHLHDDGSRDWRVPPTEGCHNFARQLERELVEARELWAIVRTFAEGSDWKRDQGEHLNTWIQRAWCRHIDALKAAQSASGALGAYRPEPRKVTLVFENEEQAAAYLAVFPLSSTASKEGQ